METAFKTIQLAMAFFAISIGVLHGQSGQYDLQLIAAPGGNSCEIGVILEIKASSASSQFNIADQNYRFAYDDQIIANPRIDSEILSGVNSGSMYTEHSLSGTTSQIISYQIFLVGGVGQPLSDTDWLQIGKLLFDVVDPSAIDSDLSWLTQSDFPSTFINELYQGDIYPVSEGNYNGLTAAMPQFNPIKYFSNEHICLSDVQNYYPYRIEGASGFEWSVLPLGAGEIIDSLTYTPQGGDEEIVQIKFNDLALDSVEIVATKVMPCDSAEFRWTVKFDEDGVWPGDVNYDGFVDWGTDATAYTYAMSSLYEQLQNDPTYQTLNRVFDLEGDPDMIPLSRYEWGCQYGVDWMNQDGTHFDFEADSSMVNMKHADCNGDGIFETGTVGYKPIYSDLSQISNGPSDLDVVARYHHLLVAEHDGNEFKNNDPSDLIQITAVDSVLTDTSELMLIINLGSVEEPIEDVHSLAFILDFSIGEYELPYVELSNTHLDDPMFLNATEYNVLENLEDGQSGKWFVSLGREDLSGINFTGEEVCSVICEMTITGFGKKIKNLTKGPIPDTTITISILSAGLVKSDGSFVKLQGGSTTVGVILPVLPLELLSFTAARVEKDVSLQWVSATEVDFSGFEVERSVNGSEFNKITWVPSKAKEGLGAVYNYNDVDPGLKGTVYYRLKMIDEDGPFEYSEIVSVEFPQGGLTSVNVFPLPATDRVNVAFESIEEGEGAVSLFNGIGQKLMTKSFEFAEGQNQIVLDVDDLSSGLYFIVIEKGPYKIIRRTIKISNGQ